MLERNVAPPATFRVDPTARLHCVESVPLVVTEEVVFREPEITTELKNRAGPPTAKLPTVDKLLDTVKLEFTET
jgi:hypothetical protein